jgi:hypothetical protein
MGTACFSNKKKKITIPNRSNSTVPDKQVNNYPKDIGEVKISVTPKGVKINISDLISDKHSVQTGNEKETSKKKEKKPVQERVLHSDPPTSTEFSVEKYYNMINEIDRKKKKTNTGKPRKHHERIHNY